MFSLPRAHTRLASPVTMPPPLDPEAQAQAQGTELADLTPTSTHPPPPYDNVRRPPEYEAELPAAQPGAAENPAPPPVYTEDDDLRFPPEAWIASKLEKTPEPLKSWAQSVARWCRGPQSPKVNRINPLFELIQTIPAKLAGIFPSYVRWGAVIFVLGVWAAIFGSYLVQSAEASPADYINGTLYRLTCTNRLWYVYMLSDLLTAHN